MASTPTPVHHPSAMRNRIPVLKTMLSIVDDTTEGRAMEVASGTGALLEVMVPAYPQLEWQPSEYVPEVTASQDEQWNKYGKIGSRQGLSELAQLDLHGTSVFPNCLPSISLSLLSPWPPSAPPSSYSLIVCTNTLHITPSTCTSNLLKGSSSALAKGGSLIVYGPFKVDGCYIGADGGEGNARFDDKLRSTNEQWGLRDVKDIEDIANKEGMRMEGKHEMPANNLLLHFVKEG